MGNLVDHAKRELEYAGMFDDDADYRGEIAYVVMELVEVFEKQQHSGMSAALTLEFFTKLARFKTLSPITVDPDEWLDRSDISGYPLWQNTRDSAVFSEDGGLTWYDVEDPEAVRELAKDQEGAVARVRDRLLEKITKGNRDENHNAHVRKSSRKRPGQ